MKKSVSINSVTGLILMSLMTLISQSLYSQEKSYRIFDNPPDTVPEIFGKGVVSLPDRYEYGLAISSDYKELLFTLEDRHPTVMVMRRNDDGSWTAPVPALLRGEGIPEFEAFYDYGGRKLYFSSDINDTTRLWFCTRNGERWTDPVLADKAINSTPVFWATFTRDHTMYFTNIKSVRIYKSRLENGRYRSTEDAGLPFGIHPFVAKDESFILFNGRGDIYIAYREKDGSWGKPVRFGNNVNTKEYDETCASLSPDGKYIFFSRYNELNGKSDIYWAASGLEKVSDTWKKDR